jgi:hypothetical protein
MNNWLKDLWDFSTPRDPDVLFADRNPHPHTHTHTHSKPSMGGEVELSPVPVEDWTDEEWFKMLGNKEAPLRLEEQEKLVAEWRASSDAQ